MEIKEKLTKVNFWKGDGSGNNKINKYIVIHYVGAVSTASNNASYFNSVNRGASANYFVDENDIYRVVKDSDSAWHCGANTYYCGARNTNSIGIEMCCFNNNGTIDVSDKVVERTIQLTKELMDKYNIPASNVVRHYDVTHKNCPAPFVNNSSRWNDFKSKLTGTYTSSTTVNSGEAVDQILHVGSKVQLNGIYKINAVNAKLNGVICQELVGTPPYQNYHYIDATPCYEVDRFGNKTKDQICDTSHYLKIPGTFTVLAIDKKTNSCKIKIGCREVWVYCKPCTEI